MRPRRVASRPLAYLALLALGACAGTLLSGTAAALTYTSADLITRHLGVTLQHLRPLHESFAFAWVFLGGVTIVYLFLHETEGPFPTAVRRRLSWHSGLWAAAGAGIVAAALSGQFTGREYLGYHPGFSLVILIGWVLFGINFFGRRNASLRSQPVYVYMWSVAIPLFAVTYIEGHAYLIEYVSRRPVRDLALQWKSAGTLVGSFNLLAYGSLTFVAGRIHGDTSYAYSRTAFALFWVGLLNTFTNYGHHTYHLPQSPWIHWTSFVVSMLEVIILARVLHDILRLLRDRTAGGEREVCHWFLRSATVWTGLLLLLALAIAVPPLNALIHGTHVVVAHSMGSMIGIDSMILWAAFAFLLERMVSRATLERTMGRVRRMLPLVALSLVSFLGSFFARGIAGGWSRYTGAAAPDFSVWLAVFPTLMLVTGVALAFSVLFVIGQWMALLWCAIRAPDDEGGGFV